MNGKVTNGRSIFYSLVFSYIVFCTLHTDFWPTLFDRVPQSHCGRDKRRNGAEVSREGRPVGGQTRLQTRKVLAAEGRHGRAGRPALNLLGLQRRLLGPLLNHAPGRRLAFSLRMNHLNSFGYMQFVL